MEQAVCTARKMLEFSRISEVEAFLSSVKSSTADMV
jgi:hypothetical protein